MAVKRAGPCDCECASCEIGAHCREGKRGCLIDSPEIAARGENNEGAHKQSALVEEVFTVFSQN